AMIRQAHARGLLTTPYCFNEQEAEQMADAGADILVAHMGLTTKGAIGARTALTLDEAAVRVQRIADAAPGVMCWSSVTAGLSPSRKTPQLSSRRHVILPDFMARLAWSGFPPNALSAIRSSALRTSKYLSKRRIQ